MNQDPDRYHARIEKAANQFLASFGPGLTRTPTGHIETDIAGAASVAGVTLLRQVLPEINRFPPGSVVLGDFLEKLYAEQQQMLAFFMNLAKQMGLNATEGWQGEPPKGHAPILETSDLTRMLEPSLRRVGENCRVPIEYLPHVAGLTTMKLVAAGQQTGLLDESLGKQIAAYYLIAGSRTAPHASEVGLSPRPLVTTSRRMAPWILLALIGAAIIYLLIRPGIF